MLRHLLVATAVLTVSLSADVPQTQLITAWAGGTDQGRSIYNTTLGTPFTVGDRNLSVTALGYYDAYSPGLVNRHQIGIYDRAGTLLGAVNYTLGDATLAQGEFRYVPLETAIDLRANTTYVLAATTTGADDRIMDGVTAAAVGTGIQTIYDTLSTATPTLSSPETPVGRNLIFANFIATLD